MLPTVQELADENTSSVKFGKMDIASNMQTAMKYGIMAVPTLMVFKDGEPHGGVLRGIQPKARLQEMLEA